MAPQRTPARADHNVDREHVTTWRLLATGTRRGELLGLRWRDMDLKAGTIAVAQSVITIKATDERQHVAEGPTQSGRVRVVDVDPGTELLRAHRAFWPELNRPGFDAVAV